MVDRLCQKLGARGFRVQVITTDSMSGGEDSTWDRYREHYPLDVHRCGRLRGYAYSATLANALESAVRKSDLVHLHTLWTYPTFAAARICRRLGVPYVVMPHGMSDPHSLRRGWLKKKLYGYFFEWPNVRAAQGIIYTHAEEQRLAEASVGGLPPGHIVPLGADDPPDTSRGELAQQFFKQYPELRGTNLAIFLGRLHPKKGLDLLIPGFAEVARTDSTARLLLVGPGEEPYVKWLQELVVQQGVAGKVTFAGPLARTAKWQALAASVVFVLPSYQENFALTVVEALRSGVPVVLSRRVNIWEDVTSAGAGLPCDLAPSSVARAMLYYFRNPDQRESSAVQGQKLVAEQFNWDRSADAMEEVYRSFASRTAEIAS